MRPVAKSRPIAAGQPAAEQTAAEQTAAEQTAPDSQPGSIAVRPGKPGFDSCSFIQTARKVDGKGGNLERSCLISQNGTQSRQFTPGRQYFRHLKKLACAAEEQGEDKNMATTTSTGLPILVSARAVPRVQTRSGRRRITPQAGRALEILGHAIEYLTDEFVQQDGMVSSKNERLEAVQMLMALNRQVYYECPEVLSFGERCRALLHLHAR
jgi:hypothetical protein